MEKKEVIGWQFIDKYYNLLMQMYSTIRLSYHAEDYETAFKDIEQIYFHIYREILLNKATKRYDPVIKNLIEEIHVVRDRFNLMQLNDRIPMHSKVRRLSDLKVELRTKVSQLYKIITGVVSDLGMFSPKKRKEEGLDIYK